MTESLIQTLRGIVDERGLVLDPQALAIYNIDWRHRFHGQALCAVLPRTAQEVSAVVRACAQAGAPVVPQGGNTGLSGGATPDATGRQVVLSLARMDRIRHVDSLGEFIEVEAGCILQTAQEAAAEAGLLLPITLAAEGSARIGGVVSTNAGGTNVLRYGMARSRVLGLEVVTAEGEILNGLRPLRKDNAGYDWKHWFIGTEGTLGIVTAAVLQLAPAARHRVTALLAMPDAQAALHALSAARQTLGETLSAFELMSDDALTRVERHQGLRKPITGGPWYVLLEASSSLPGLRDAAEGLMAGLIEDGHVIDCIVAESQRQEKELWALRESISEAEAREGRSVKHDVSVPISRIPEFLQLAGETVMRRFPEARVNAFGHVGDGNMHYNIITEPSTDEHALNALVHDMVVRCGGSISAEHGIGQYRVGELIRCRPPSELAIARRIKAALDPQGLLNPGKVLSSVGDGA